MNVVHVREFEDAIGGKAHVSRRMPEPFEPAARDLEGQQALIARVDELACLDFNLGGEPPHALQVIQNEHVRIGGRGGLLETTVRRLKDGFQPLDDFGETRRIELYPETLRIRNDARWNREAVGPACLEHRVLRVFHPVPCRHHADFAFDGIRELGSLGRDAQGVLPYAEHLERET